MKMLKSAGDASTRTFYLAAAANGVDHGVLVVDASGRIAFANSVFYDLLGYDAHETIGADIVALLGYNEISPARLERTRDAIASGTVIEEDRIARTKAGKTLCVTTRLSSLINPDNGERYSVVAVSNITESKQIQTMQRDVLEAIAQDAPLDAVMDLLCRRVEGMAPDVYSSVLAVDETERLRPLAGPRLPQAVLKAADGLEIGPDVGSCGAAAASGETVIIEDIASDPRYERFRELLLPIGFRSCWSSPIKLRDGRVAGTFAFYYRSPRAPSRWHQHIVEECLHLCMVAMERAEAKARIARLAYFDGLTGLPNRSRLHERLNQIVTGTGARLAVLFFDIDHFKDVNDTLGHAFGDGLLVTVARRLEPLLRGEDLLVRLGGDEFVLLMSGADAAQAAQMAQAVQQALREPVQIDGLSVPVSASIGISLSPVDGTDADALLKTADTAMYQAKAAGRGTFRFYSPVMNSPAHDRLLLGTALRDAIAGQQLDLHYQPQICAQDGSLMGVEALARWTHPVLGPISPARFIPLAEEGSMIEALGRWGLDEACRQLAAWDAQGLVVPSVSVNISPIQFQNRDLDEIVAETLARHRLRPDRLVIEMTERVVLDECPIAIENAHALHRRGVTLSMDDFGTGYSSLSHLAKLPAGEIKIDRSFMREIETGEGPRAIVTAVIRIGQSLGMRVVAEGVETDAQHRFLSSLGCDVLQGFLFAPALPAGDFVRWLEDRNRAVA